MAGIAERPTRGRRTKAAMTAFREALYSIVETNKPCSVRQVYYVGIGRLWEKDTGGDRTAYNDVVRNLGEMRERGQLPWGWLVDSTRYVRVDTMYESLTDALERTREAYRRNLWATQPRRVEVWAESDSTAALIEGVTRALGVGLYSCKGQAGKEFAYSSAMTYLTVSKPVTILYVGDWDPSGLAIPRSLEERLNRYVDAGVAAEIARTVGAGHPVSVEATDRPSIELRRLAVTPEQIFAHSPQRHDVNTRDSSYKRFVEECRLVGLAELDAVEVEAFPPPLLRQVTEKALYALVDDAAAWNREIDLEEFDNELLAEMSAQGWSVR